jgi:hypothetical protein
MAAATAHFFRSGPAHLVLNAYTYPHASLLFTALTVSLSWALPVPEVGGGLPKESASPRRSADSCSEHRLR